MTREEAIKMAKADLKCMERDTSGQDEMCNSHKCDECSLNYERGNMGEQKEWLRLAIKALEQEPFINKPCISEKVCEHDKNAVLDKIREEIVKKHLSVMEKNDFESGRTYGYEEILEIIDKYKAESEGENDREPEKAN